MLVKFGSARENVKRISGQRRWEERQRWRVAGDRCEGEQSGGVQSRAEGCQAV